MTAAVAHDGGGKDTDGKGAAGQEAGDKGAAGTNAADKGAADTNAANKVAADKAPAGKAPAGSVKPPWRVWAGRLISLAVVFVLFGAVLPHLVDLRLVADAFRAGVDGDELSALAVLTALSVVVSSLGLVAGLPGLKLAQATVINLVTTAVAYAVPGGAAAGTALNVTMLRELGFGRQAIALEVLATGIWNLGVRLIMPLLALGLLSVASDVPAGVRSAGVLGLVLAAVLTVLLVATVWWERPAVVIGEVLAKIVRRLPGRHELSPERVELFQGSARQLIRSRWPLLTLSSVGYHVVLFMVLYTSLQAVGVTEIGVLEAFAAYTVVRQVTALPITPGSAGVMELALIGGLGLTGADLPAVTAGVLLFRFFTYLLYLPVGGGLWLWWRIRRRRPPAPDLPLFRHPADAARLVTGVVLLLLSAAMARGPVGAFEAGVFRLVNELPDALTVPVWVVMQAGWVGTVFLAALAAAFLTRRIRLPVDLILSGGLAWVLAKAVKDLAGRPRPGALLDDVILRLDAGIGGTGFVAGHTAVAAALATTAGAYLPRPYRRALWAVVAGVGFARVYVGAHLPLDVIAGAALGWAVAAGVQLVRGTPGHYPGVRQVREAFGRRGTDLAAIERIHGDLRRAVPFMATLAVPPAAAGHATVPGPQAGERVFIKAVGRDQRDADWMHRLQRVFRGPAPPFATPKHQLEHEAYLIMTAARAGARVPRVRSTTPGPDGTWFLALEFVDGRTLAEPGEDLPEVDDALLDRLWEQITLIHKAGLAHRDLRPDNVIIDPGGLPWLVGWATAKVDARPEAMHTDAERLLALTTRLTGQDRALAAATRALGAGQAARLAEPLPDGALHRAHAVIHRTGSRPVTAVPTAEPRRPWPLRSASGRPVRRRPLRQVFSGWAREAEPPPTAHHPGDVVRILTGLTAGLSLAVFAAGGFLLSLEANFFRLINRLPEALFYPIYAVMQVGSLGAVGVAALVAAAGRRFRLAVDLLIGGSAAWFAAKLVKSIADRGRPGRLLDEVVLRGATEGGLGFVSGHAAVAAALATVASAHVRRPVRWALWTVVVLVGIGRMYVGAHFPLDVLAGAALGLAIGGAIHLVRGTPSHRPSPAQVARGLAHCGLGGAQVTLLESDARGSVPFIATTDAGERLFVKALSHDQRDADLLFKGARYLLYRELEDEAPLPTPKRQLEREAYALMRADQEGVRVPEFLGIARVGPGLWILAERAVAGTGTGDLASEAGSRIDDAFLRELWGEVAKLRRARIAHRDLRLANVMIDQDGHPVIVDFGFAEDGAFDHRLSIDVAELLTSTAYVVGANRAVAAAVDVLGPEALRDVGQHLQPLALARSTRVALHDRPRLLERIRHELTIATGQVPEEPEQMARLRARPWTLLGLLVAALLLYQLLFGVGGVRHPAAVLQDMSVRWLLVAAGLVAASYAAGAVSLIGASRRRLALGRTYVQQVAASYAGRMYRPGRGADSVLRAYLIDCGATDAEAAGTVGLTRVTGAVVHVIALCFALAAVLIQGWNGLHWPSWWPAAAIPLGLAVPAGTVVLWRHRSDFAGPLLAAIRTLPGRLRLPQQPVTLLAGSAAVTSCSVLAFIAVAQAAGLGLSAVTVAAVYLAVIPIRLLGPLPGGIGVVEPVLALVLTALGAGPTEAVMTVVVFRVLAFWLPILPGAAAFHGTGRRRREAGQDANP